MKHKSNSWLTNMQPWHPKLPCVEAINTAMFDCRLNGEGRANVNSAIANGPSRRVQSHRGNVTIRFTSTKMATQVMLESRRGELPLAVLAEANPDVVAFFAQPDPIELEIKDASGKVLTRLSYTPDLMVVFKNAVEIWEARDLAKLAADHLKNPMRFVLTEDGQWHDRAAEEAYKKLGFQHRLIDNSSIPSVLVRNIRFLEDYTRSDSPPLDPKVGEAIAAYVQAQRFVTLHHLIRLAGFKADDVYKLVLLNGVYVDMKTQLLDNSSDLTIYSDATTCAAHQRVATAQLEKPLPVPGRAWIRTGGQLKYQGVTYTVILVGERDVLVRNSDGIDSTLQLEALRALNDAGHIVTDALTQKSDIRQLADFSPEEIERAMARMDAIANPGASKYSIRQINKFRRCIAHCVTQIDALIALMDRQRDRGNFKPRHPSRSQDLLRQAIDEHYNKPERPTRMDAWKEYVKACRTTLPDQSAVTPISYSRFCKSCNEHEDVKKREGKKQAYQKRAIVQSLDNAYPVHGLRPHEVVHIDHTVATMATISPNGADLGKPYLSIAFDACIASCRAMVLSYNPPSSATVLLLLRDYVRRNGRAPSGLVLDHGKEFKSAELAFFCALHGIEIRYRPPGMPRGGSPVERAFGSLETEVFAALEGNTRQMRDPRLVTAEVNPFARATWTLTALYYAIEKYFFQDKPNEVSPALGMTPKEYEKKLLEETGQRAHMLVRYDENLMLLTCPHPTRRHHVVDPKRGVWVNGMWYMHPDFKKLLGKTKAEVRVEPWLHRVVYVQINQRWVAATASNARWVGNKTKEEVEIALREERRQAGADA
ncbi:transposase [Pseudorhodoferax aquiterrae]|uniref:Transposase n=1 Tax=Pseudorhodoferax aquiterrae TaxID=747304 RepID=A0ABQ3G2N0_9BURK|nr:DDE-type integrase/transposase/recombinase [Pseudorhodoferax aquiterrae]GHC85098.1 transposase [Pseudorhodoferax aquiterrae]